MYIRLQVYIRTISRVSTTVSTVKKKQQMFDVLACNNLSKVRRWMARQAAKQAENGCVMFGLCLGLWAVDINKKSFFFTKLKS